MPLTRKQKAKEKRTRQSDVMSDIENLDVMFENYRENEIRDQGDFDDIDLDLESGRQQQSTSCTDINYRSLLNTNLSENSESTAETNRMINSKISSQMSRKLEEMKSYLNSHILEEINSAIKEKIVPCIENAVASSEAAKNTKWDLRSDGRHPSIVDQTTQNIDPQSDRLHKNKFNQQTQCLRENFPRLITTSSNRDNNHRDSPVGSESNDECYDMNVFSTMRSYKKSF